MPAVEATVITPPRPRSTIAGRKAWVRVTTASQLTRTISASRSGSSSRKRPRRPKPALLTSRSTSTPSFSTFSGSVGGVGDEVALDHVGRGRELLGELFEAVLAAGDQDQVVAATGELSGEFLADARGRAGDQCRLCHGSEPIPIRGAACAADAPSGVRTSGRWRLAPQTFEDRIRSWEAEYLWDLATPSYPAQRREPEPDSPVRTPFQRDRDRIVHSKAFRRLKHKTQVFVAPEGDHYRTRLTHTLEACFISRTVARALGLNEDLTEAIGLGHDLGHPPFGHIGEEVLDEALREHGMRFRHNEHSLRVVEVLARDGRGLNLTEQVRDGILNHTGPGKPATLEGRVVRIVDRVAYINHDIDDAVRAGIISDEDLPAEEIELLGETGARADRPAGAGHGGALPGRGGHRAERGGRRGDAAAAEVHVRAGLPRGGGAGRAGAGAGWRCGRCSSTTWRTSTRCRRPTRRPGRCSG